MLKSKSIQLYELQTMSNGKNANVMDYSSDHDIELQYVVNVSGGHKYRSVTEKSYFDTKLPLYIY